MEISLKQRLVGAAVLIALGVIFIPMFLDGAGHREKISMDMAIPPEPEFTFDQQLPPVPAVESAVSSPEKNADQVVVKEGAQEPPAKTEPIVEPKTTAAPKTQEKPRTAVAKALPPETTSTAQEKPKVAATLAKPKTKAEPAPKPALNAWVVQVGSFGQQTNALALRDKLRAAGYAAFDEKAGKPDAPVFRVKVGPEIKRDRAEALQVKLLKEEKLDGIVVSHP